MTYPSTRLRGRNPEVSLLGRDHDFSRVTIRSSLPPVDKQVRWKWMHLPAAIAHQPVRVAIF